jgi:transposase
MSKRRKYDAGEVKIAIHLKEQGRHIRDIAKLIGIPFGTISKWIAWDNKKIKDPLLKKISKKIGRPLKVKKESLEELIRSHPKANYKQLTGLYNIKMNTALAINTITSAFKELNFKRIVGQKELIGMNQEAFELSKQQLEQYKKDYINGKSNKLPIYFDEMTIKSTIMNERKISVKKGEIGVNKQISRIGSSISYLGGINSIDGEVYASMMLNKRVNSLVVEEELTKIIKKALLNSKNESIILLIILDNASYHKTKNIKALADKYPIEFYYFPHYCHQLNLQEHVNSLIKRRLSDLYAYFYSFLIQNKQIWTKMFYFLAYITVDFIKGKGFFTL